MSETSGPGPAAADAADTVSAPGGTVLAGRSPGPAASADPVIAVEKLVHVYPEGTRALDGIDLAIRRGERVAIVGQNGSGKSTLVRHFNGLLRPTEGRVLVDGADALGRRVAHLAATVGLAFQDPDRQIFAGKVRNEVAFGPRNLGRPSAAVDAAVAEALVATGLDKDADTNPYDLGYSRRKLLALASILAMGTPVVVLDEPTTGQDARGVDRIHRIVADLAAAGRTVIAISHDMRFVAEAFERVVVMREGRIVLDGPPATVFGEAAWPTLASTFLEPPLAARVGARLGLGSTPTEALLLSAIAGDAAGTIEP
jgi:energy-coupling factor transport system ATP-binding protein